MSPAPAAPTLLYVEDERLIQDFVVPTLEEAGFEILVATNGEQALSILNIESATVQGLITDVNLGEGPNGWDVARHARQLTAALPVIYVSAASEQEWTSMGVPNSLMIAKPFAPAQIVVAISSLLVVSDGAG
jgi:DNA-binding response OmpR family regulator